MPDDSPSLLNRVTRLERKIRDGLTLAKLTLTGTLTGVAAVFSSTVTASNLTVTTTYTPTWSATGTAVSLGDGVISGRYVRAGGLVMAWINLTMGSTTTYGTGVYEFTVPTSINATPRFLVGAAHLLDTGTADYSVEALLDSNTGKVRLWSSAAPGVLVGPTAPFTFAVGDGIYIAISYPI